MGALNSNSPTNQSVAFPFRGPCCLGKQVLGIWYGYGASHHPGQAPLLGCDVDLPSVCGHPVNEVNEESRRNWGETWGGDLGWETVHRWIRGLEVASELRISNGGTHEIG